MSYDPDAPLIDPTTAACLGGGWHAVSAVRHDGTVSLWLLDPEGHGDAPAPAIPRHEHTGRLPRGVAARLDETRCRANTKTGAPCGNPAKYGAYCWVHRDREEVTR